MRLLLGHTLAVTLSAFSMVSLAHGQAQQTSKPKVTVYQTEDGEFSLSPDDRLSVIAAALDAKAHLHSEGDCSHLVHTVYARAGFPYAYVPSLNLYRGIGAFQRTDVPEPGDLVVWRGHVGIVIKPSQHIFFSSMSSGPGIDDWETAYWKQRGRARFYHYIKKSRQVAIHFSVQQMRSAK